MKDQWNQSGKFHFYGTIVIYALLFFVSIIVASHQKAIFSQKDISDYGASIIVGVGTGENEYPTNSQALSLLGTGFWVNTNGAFLTCVQPRLLRLKAGSFVLTNWDVFIIFPPELKRGIASVIIISEANPMIWDKVRYTMLAFVAPNFNPFTRKTYEGRSVVKYNIPVISKTEPNVGDLIYIPVAERVKEGVAPSMVEGHIERIGVDVSIPTLEARFYTSILFKPSYLGAPVLNESEEVIGVVGNYQPNIAVIPTTHIIELLDSIKQ